MQSQDVFNSIIAHNPEVYFRLPCEWNFQVGRFSIPHCCPAIWPTRKPNEGDCITGSTSPGSRTKPNLIKLAHFDQIPKPESADLHPWVGNQNNILSKYLSKCLTQFCDKCDRFHVAGSWDISFRRLPSKPLCRTHP